MSQYNVGFDKLEVHFRSLMFALAPLSGNDGLVATRCSSTWNEAAGEQHPWQLGGQCRVVGNGN